MINIKRGLILLIVTQVANAGQMCHSKTCQSLATRRVVTAGQIIVIKQVANKFRQYHCIGILRICSDLPEEVEVLNRHSDPQVHVATMHKYSKFWLWSKHMIWISKSNPKSKCDLMLGI